MTRYPAYALTLFLSLAALPAAAQDDMAQDATPQKTNMKVVTPLKACLDQLPPEEAAIVRQDYERPYQACRAHLADYLRKKASVTPKNGAPQAAGANAAGQGDMPVTPRNFVRVQKDPDPYPAYRTQKGDLGLNNAQPAEKAAKKTTLPRAHYNN
jgi:hypothetical protein